MRLWERSPEPGRAHVYKKGRTWFVEFRDHQGQCVAEATYLHKAALRAAIEATSRK